MQEAHMAANKDVTSYTLKQALAARVGDHVEIAVEVACPLKSGPP